MGTLYAPLRIAKQLRDGMRKQESLKKVTGTDQFPFMSSVMNAMLPREETSSQVLNLDDFMSWVIGSTFAKRNYDGQYEKLNSQILNLCNKKGKLGRSYKEVRKQTREIILFTSMFECWETYKQAYRFDSDFVDELLLTEAVNIPVDILKRLPYRCFYLDLEDVKRFEPSEGIFAYIGFDEKNGYPNLAIFRVEPPGNKPNKDMLRTGRLGEEERIFPLYAYGEDMKRWNMLMEREDGNWYLQFSNQKKAASLLPGEKDFEVVLLVLQAMLYLSSNKPDTMESPKRKYIYTGKRRDNTQGTVDLALTDVGVRYGAVIRKAKKEAEEDTKVIEVANRKTRKPMVSHVRCAHWHHYWVGKGRQERIVKWVPPTFVSGYGKELLVTIHKISVKKEE